MNDLIFPLTEDGCVNRWLVSQIHCTPVSFEPVTLNGDINLWLKEGFSIHENPCKARFAEQMRNTQILPPECARLQAGEQMTVDGREYTFRIYFPWNDNRLDLSGCWDKPARLDAWAYTEIEASQQELAVFEFTTCGGMQCWCNGLSSAQMLPYTRNIPQNTLFPLRLQAGINTILVHLNDLAERDCAFYLKMRYCGTQALRQRFSIAEPTAASCIAACERSLESLSFTRDNFSEGYFELSCQNDTGGPLSVEYICAAEENEINGIFHHGIIRFDPGYSVKQLEACEHLPFGYLSFRFTVNAGRHSITCSRAAENHPFSLLPPYSPDINIRKKQGLEIIARYGEENANRALAILHASSSHELLRHACQLLTQQAKTVSARYDCSDFYLVYFPHILRRFRGTDRLPEALANKLEQCILEFRYWMDEPGDDVMWFFSENHALLFHTCALLAGELYPNRIFTNSGLSGRQLSEKATSLLNRWFGSFFSEGFTEWNSSAYLPIDMLGFASLYAFAENEAIRQQAKRGMDFICLLLAQHSLNGILAASAGRTYHKEQFGNRSNCTSAISYICFGAGTLSHAGKGIVSLCLSEYTPPDDYKAWLFLPYRKLLEVYSVHGYQKHASLYTCKTARFLLTAACDFRSGHSGYQENPCQIAFSATALFFVNHPGEKAVWGCGRPSYWAGNGILPQVHACRHGAVLMFDIPENHPVDFTHLYFPSMEFHSWEQNGNILLCEYQGAYAAIFCSLPLKPSRVKSNAGREWIACGRKAIWLFRIGCQEQYGKFEHFRKAVLNAAFSPCTDSLMTVHYADPAIGHIDDRYGGILAQNGEDIVFPDCDQYGRILCEDIMPLPLKNTGNKTKNAAPAAECEES